ncbi:MAG: hypothetical protein JWO05_2021 [Gemmatimonadetes bacterium]|nr:hypothetical protein [Gemmatimonadota bacterium]
MRKTMMLVAVAATLGGAACSALGKQVFQEPVVALKDVKLRGVGLTGGNVDVVLSVYNPNEFRLDATRMTYRVLLGDSVSFASGALDSRTTVQSKDSTFVTIPVSFTYNGLGAAGRSLLNSGAVDYKVIGDVTVGSPLGNHTIPFTSTGRFSTLGFGR